MSSRMEKSVGVNGSLPGPVGSLYVDDGGVGRPPVVFVHAFAGSSRAWSDQLDHVRSHRRGVAFDLRGHGHSDPPGQLDYTVAGFADDLGAVIQGLDLGRCVVVGHSLGGAAAIAYAGAHPDSVTGLVLVGTPGRSSPAQTKQIMGAMEADYDSVSEQYWKKLLEGARPEVERQVRDERHHVRRDAALAIMKAVFAYDPLPDLRKYPGPKHLIDTAVADSPGSLHALAPDIPRDTIAGTSHWTYMDAPRHFNELLDRCLHVMK